MAEALRRYGLLTGGLALVTLCAALGLHAVLGGLGPRGLSVLTAPQPADGLRRIIVLHALLPRVAVALIAGAALGLAGALLQRVLRNPIADASTLGISAGAQLALVAATAFLPELGGLGRETVALAGGAVAVAVVLGLGWRRGFEATTLALAGLLIGLLCASAGAAIILFSGQYLTSMFIWGGGSLAQQSWEPAKALALRLFICAGLAALLQRPLAVLALGEAGARNLGLSVRGARFYAVFVAVALAGSVVSQVGIIGFIGLAAPNIARMLGARRPGAQLLASPLIGALLLSLTDGLVQATNAASGLGTPTGAVAALLGGPFLLFLLPRLPAYTMPPQDSAAFLGRVAHRPWRLIAVSAAMLAALVLLALVLGRDADGLDLAMGAAFGEVLPWRWPRLMAAMAAGAMLAAAGAMIQRLTGNPLASPEVLGISSAAGLGLALTIVLVPGADWWLQGLASAGGAALGLLILLAIARQFALTASRMLLGGIALAAFSGSILTVMLARGGLESFAILAWLTGSTQQVTPDFAVTAAVTAIALLLPLPLFVRWLQILPLGDATSAGLGIAIMSVKTRIVICASLLTGAATLIVGPVSFVGLMAPHLARALGLRGAATHLAGAVLLGALLLAMADWLSRLAFFPYQMPVGLFASLIGAPYLVWTLVKDRNG
ncbi:Fe(3+)-hydroxamate ABC transporter permease FhuB [Bosea sp. BK604]|uniref:Fe(3+)-hydroxamate ABC transporter permease FhuB n=1 Tax=Bosea sp. BK604 TaxID=2512180 RepID=UPI0010D72507|nr:Fe(3+)-hydroxamate ABC transporter permease FhuB [Bosea sp. BK604]TCR66358.1 iron complex transport system permease protein [Bosea sp. BK604]